ncbi:MAG: hypothetical protein Q9219_005891 [cf. Caloplaca sp. 3 TL-2023]
MLTPPNSKNVFHRALGHQPTAVASQTSPVSAGKELSLVRSRSASNSVAALKSSEVSITVSENYALPFLKVDLSIDNRSTSVDIDVLSDRLCAPVGGVGPSLSATVSSILSSTLLEISTTPTIPPTATAGSQVSSVLATATPAPNLGNPANILTYPACAQICNNETVAVAKRTGTDYGDLNDVRNACDADFRAATAGCEAVTCTPAEIQRTQLLAQQLCGSFYNSNPALGSSVTSAIASATAAAIAATDGKDPTDVNNLPACAQNCVKPNNFQGCGSLANLQCVCQGIQFNDATGPCELSTCSPTDLQTILYFAEKLCEPVGGVLTNPVNYTGGAGNVTGNGTTTSPQPTPFTGEAGHLRGGMLAFVATGMVVGLGMVAVVL